MRVVVDLATISLLFYIHKFRYLCIKQGQVITNSNYNNTAKKLRNLERIGFLDSFGLGKESGFKSIPKMYFLTKKGFAELQDEIDLPDDLQNYRRTKYGKNYRWSFKLWHRIGLVDVLINLELSAEKAGLNIPKSYYEFVNVKESYGMAKQTTDKIGEFKIIPDSAYILRSDTKGKDFLFFIEYDRGTEPLRRLKANTGGDFKRKLELYDKYNNDRAYKNKYGDFPYFVLLIIIVGKKRLSNIADLGRETLEHDLQNRVFLIEENTLKENNFFENPWLNMGTNKTRGLL